jgi:endonuclease YncB( thermonuclease family)
LLDTDIAGHGYTPRRILSICARSNANVDPRIRRLRGCSGGVGLSGQLTADGARGPTCDTTALVLKVVDGDTIDIRDDNRGRLRARLLGIDTPETKKPNDTVGCWGPEASEFVKSTMLGQRSRSLQTPRKACTTATAGSWPI